jgi:putative ABC transport system permease protein
MGTFLRDGRQGLRMLVNNPGFTAVAVLTLALGIGANTAIFSVVRATLLTPVPIPEPERVVMVWTEGRDYHHFPASIPDYLDWKTSGIFEQMGAMREGGFNLRFGDRTERVMGVFVTEGWFAALGIQPSLGRFYGEQDMHPGHDRVVVLTHDCWTSSFASDAAILGKSVVLDGEAHTIVGVLPKNFPKLGHEQIYAPLIFREPVASDRRTRFIGVMGKLQRGVSLVTAQQRMNELSRRLGRQYEADLGETAILQPVEQAYVEDVQTLVLVIASAVGFVLLIACANIANLLLARGTGREKEMAVRAAMGAGRWTLARQLLTESTVLALAGGLLATLLAAWGIDFIRWFKLEEMPNAELVKLDAGVFTFNLLASLVTGVLFGLAPAWQAWKTDVNETLKAAGRGSSAGANQRIRGVLVVSEIALTLVLLVGAGLMVKSFTSMRSAYPGFNSHGVLTMKIALSDRQYPTPEKQAAYFAEALRRISVLPGVTAAGAVDGLPGGDEIHGAGLRRADRPEPKLSDVPIVLVNSVMPGYFRVMQARLFRGRVFSETDRKDSAPVAIIDAWTARRYWPDTDPLGQSLRLGTKLPPRRIVGVVGDMSQGLLVKMIKGQVGQVYLPLVQEPKADMSLALRTAGAPASLTATVQKALREIDRDQPVFQVQDLDSARDASAMPQKLAAALLGAFAGVALLLAMIGIYGVVAYGAGRRMREIGIRVALGAGRRDVLKLLLGQGLVLTSIGVGIGLAGAWTLTRWMSSLLSGVEPTDPATFAVVCLLLCAAAMLASYIPARRATNVDPVEALRQE